MKLFLKVRVLVLIFFLASYTLFPVKIQPYITHGAFSAHSTWLDPGGDFYVPFNKVAVNLGYMDTLPFHWKEPYEGLTYFEKINGAIVFVRKKFNEMIENNKEGYDRICFLDTGHSYGGHVIAIASQLIRALFDVHYSFVSCRRFNHKPLFFYFHSSEDGSGRYCNALQEHRLFNYAVDALYNEFQKDMSTLYGIAKENPNGCLIQEVRTLGTPNSDSSDYVYDMTVIRYLFNYYSTGDLVQEAAGYRLLPEPRGDRAVNIRMKINLSGWPWSTGNPKHVQLHEPVVGKWLLYVPFCKQYLDKSFENFTFEHDGEICFAPQKATYKITTKDVHEEMPYARFKACFIEDESKKIIYMFEEEFVRDVSSGTKQFVTTCVKQYLLNPNTYERTLKNVYRSGKSLADVSTSFLL